MYDELVKNLRNRRICVQSGGDLGKDFPLMKEAADVIEELSKYADAIRKLKCEGWYLQQTKYHDGYQAVSTMPLPEPPKEET